MNKKIFSKILVIAISFLCIFKVDATTIREVTTADGAHDVIAYGTKVIGITKFNSDTIITGVRAAKAGYNDALFKVSNNLPLTDPSIYFYYGEAGWFELNEAGRTAPVSAATVGATDLYYIDNVEKKITVPYTGTVANNSLPNNVTYNSTKQELTVPATLVDFSFKNEDGGTIEITSTPSSDQTHEVSEVSYSISYYDTLGTILGLPVYFRQSEVTVAPTNPTQGHDIFIGWVYKDTVTPFSFGGHLNADINLQSVFVPATTLVVDLNYTGSFNYTIYGIEKNETFDSNEIVIKNQLVTPSRVGYSFEGWFTDSECLTAFDKAVTPVIDGMTIYADWSPIEYVVEFDANGGINTTSSVTCTYGVSCALTSNNFSKAGYTFAGWSLTSDGDVLFEDSDSVSNLADEAITLTFYAVWNAKETTVALNQNGGTNGDSSLTATFDASIPTITNLPTKVGYNFIGYYDAMTEGTKYINADGTSAISWDKDISESTLYAHWTAKETTVTLNKNEGTGGDSSLTATYNAAMPTVANLPTKVGYTFVGYYDAITDGVKYINADGTSAISWNKDASTSTLYAIWSANTTSITIDQSGAIEENGSIEATYGVLLPTIKDLPTKEGYTFLGYYNTDESAHYGERIYDQSGITTKVWDVDEREYTLYAHWTAKVTSITLNQNGGIEENGSTEATYNAAMTTIISLPTKEGYTFLGYYDDIVEGTKYINADGTSAISWNKDASTSTLYAHWAAKVTSITLNQNGGIEENGSTEATYDAAMTTIISLPTKEGYTFLGYYDAILDGTKYINADGTSATSWNKDASTSTLYAHWEAITYTIRFNGNGNTSGTMEDLSVLYDEDKNLSSNLYAKSDMIFIGWATSSEGEVVYNDGDSISNLANTNGTIVNLYAKWTEHETVVTLNANGGEFDALVSNPFTMTIAKGSTTTSSNLPTKEGYTLLGFYDSVESGTKYINADGTSAKNWDKNDDTFTLYAHWEANEYDLSVKVYLQSIEDVESYVLSTTIPSNFVYDETNTDAEEYEHSVTGFTFNSSKSTKYYKNIAENQEISLYFNRNVYTVIFKYDADTTISSDQLKYDETITYPANPTNEVQVFIGWDNNITKVAGDVTITANWMPVTNYAGINRITDSIILGFDLLNYDATTGTATEVIGGYTDFATFANENNGQVTLEYSITAPDGAIYWKDNLLASEYNTISSTLPTFEIVTYTTLGGKIVGNQSTPVIYFYNSNKELIAAQSSQISLINYEDVEVTLKYNNDTEDNTFKVLKGNTITVPTNPIKEGWEFVNWYLRSGEILIETPYDFETPINNNILIEAVYKFISEVSLNNNYGTTDGDTTSVNAELGQDMPALEGAMPTKTGYTFDGYFATIESDSKQYYSSTGTSVNTWDIENGFVSLYAHWTPINYTISFDTNGDESGATVTGFDCSYSEACTLPSPTLVKDGYVFNGWSKTRDGAKAYNNADIIIEEDKPTVDGETLTLYANYMQITHPTSMTRVTNNALYANDIMNYDPETGIATESITGPITWGDNTVVLDYKIEIPENAKRRSYTNNYNVAENINSTYGVHMQTTTYNSSKVVGTNNYINYFYDATGELISVEKYTITTVEYVEYNVTLEYNNGEENGTIVGVKDMPITQPENPIKTNWYFEDWYQVIGEEQASTPYDFDTPLTGAITLRAVYTLDTRITLNANEGTLGTSSEVMATNGEAMPTLEGTMPTRAGYTFTGFYSTTTGEGVQYYSNTGISTHNWDQEAETVTLYARWTPITYTLELNSNGSLTTIDSIICTYDETCTIPDNYLEKDNYIFIGWSLTQDGPKKYERNANVLSEDMPTTNESTLTLYASYIEITYSSGISRVTPDEALTNDILTYDPNSGNITEYFTGVVNYQNAQSNLVTLDYTLNAPLNAVKWGSNSTAATATLLSNSEASISVVVYNKETSVKSSSAQEGFNIYFFFDENDELIAAYKYAITTIAYPGEYTVSFNYNYGEEPTVISIQTLNGNYYGLPTEEPTRTGYTFVEWKDGEDNSFNPATANTANTYYASWTANTYTVVYNQNVENAEDPVTESGKTYDVPFNLDNYHQEVSGKRFLGWSTDPNDLTATYSYDEQTDQITTQATNLTAEANGVVNLYAIWETTDMTVLITGYCEYAIYDSETGLTTCEESATAETSPSYVTVEETVAYGGTLDSTLYNYLTSKSGYIFDGWYEVTDECPAGHGTIDNCDTGLNPVYSSSEYDFQAPITTNNLRIEAQFRGMKYTLQFNLNSATATGNIASVQLGLYESYALPNTGFSNSGYEFIGWSNVNNYDVDNYSNNSPESYIFQYDPYSQAMPTVNQLSETEGSVVTLYAIWKKEQSILYVTGYGMACDWDPDANEGNGSCINMNSTYHEITGKASVNKNESIDISTLAPRINYRNYTLAEITTKEGYSFVNWYEILTPYSCEVANADGTCQSGEISEVLSETPFDFSKGISETTYIKAVFEIQSYELTYDLNGGVLPDGVSLPEAATYTYNTEYTIPNLVPTKEGSEFVGWEVLVYFEAGVFTMEEGWFNEEDIFGEEVIYLQSGTTNVYNKGKNIKLTAIWSYQHMNVRYDLSGGSIDESNAPVIDTDGINYNDTQYTLINISNPTKEDYTFIGWSLNRHWDIMLPEEEQKSLLQSNEVLTLMETYTGGTDSELVLFAIYANNTVSISYDINDSEISHATLPDGVSLPTDSVMTYNQQFTLTNIVPTREGYIFKGWSIMRYENYNSYMTGTIDSIIITDNMIDEENNSLVLYAVWIPQWYEEGKATNNFTIDTSDGVSYLISIFDTVCPLETSCTITLDGVSLNVNDNLEIPENMTLIAKDGVYINSYGPSQLILTINGTLMVPYQYGSLTLSGETYRISATGKLKTMVPENISIENPFGVLDPENAETLIGTDGKIVLSPSSVLEFGSVYNNAQMKTNDFYRLVSGTMTINDSYSSNAEDPNSHNIASNMTIELAGGTNLVVNYNTKLFGTITSFNTEVNNANIIVNQDINMSLEGLSNIDESNITVTGTINDNRDNLIINFVTESPQQSSSKQGEPYTITYSPYRSGMTFVGWSTTLNGEVEYYSNQEILSLEGTLNGSMYELNLYPIFVGSWYNTYNTSFNIDNPQQISDLLAVINSINARDTYIEISSSIELTINTDITIGEKVTLIANSGIVGSGNIDLKGTLSLGTDASGNTLLTGVNVNMCDTSKLNVIVGENTIFYIGTTGFASLESRSTATVTSNVNGGFNYTILGGTLTINSANGVDPSFSTAFYIGEVDEIVINENAKLEINNYTVLNGHITGEGTLTINDVGAGADLYIINDYEANEKIAATLTITGDGTLERRNP